MLIRLLLFCLLSYPVLSASDTIETNTTAPEGVKFSSEQEKEAYTEGVAEQENVIISGEELEAVSKAAESNETKAPQGPIVIKDSSGLSEDTVREIAKEADKKETAKTIKEAAETADNNQTAAEADKKKEEKAAWENMAPAPDGYDWMQTTSGEWLKGEFKSLYNKKLEFDSDEMDLQTFDFKDVQQIRTYHIVTVNIGNLAEVTGILRLKENKVVIIQGDGKFEVTRDQVVSIAHGGDGEINYWSGKMTLSYSLEQGNTDQSDYVAKGKLERNAARSRLRLDYLGNISNTNNEKTADNHRINEKFDVFLTRRMFWSMLFSELYKDEFQNISLQATVGSGLGYTILDTDRIEWDVTGGPAVIYTKFESVAYGQDDRTLSPALQISTSLDIEITKMTDFEFDYKLTWTDKKAGSYKHHLVATLENELTNWLDLDFSFIWDHTTNPAENTDGSVPEKDDYKTTVGLGIDF